MQKLISLLQQNARLSNAQLAVMLGKTEEEVAADIRKLEEDGIIKGYSVILNEEAINKDMVTAIVELRVTPQRDCGFESIARTIMQYDEVESISLMAGAYDFAVTVKGANVKDVSCLFPAACSARKCPLYSNLLCPEKVQGNGKNRCGRRKGRTGLLFPVRQKSRKIKRIGF